MRNFWLTADIDGRQTLLTGGPRAKNGEMTVEIRQRCEGASTVALVVNCIVRGDYLYTEIKDCVGRTITVCETKR